MANIYDPDHDEIREEDGFRAKRARVGLQAGARRLGASVWELPAGQAAYPYHFHLGEEEIVFVLEGEPVLRGPEGERALERGEVVVFPRGEEGAHQIINRGEGVVRFLAVSTNGDPDIVVYPDSNKLSAAERRPDGGGLKEYFRLDDAVDYWEGESRE
jgi:uncharacterized cupin superfamily protein